MIKDMVNKSYKMAQSLATVERERESHILEAKKRGGFNFKRNGGITLIGLIITIVIMLILTGITINLLFGDNGIITKTKMAKKAFLGEDAREVVEDRVNAYITEYGSKGDLTLFDFWAMYNSSELLDASGNGTGQANPNYDENFVIYLFEEEGAVGFTPTIQAYNKSTPYSSAVVIYKGYQATVNKNLTVAKKVTPIEDLTPAEIAKISDLTPGDVHDNENEGIPGASKWDSTMGIQTPALSDGMVPVIWDEDASKWKICSASESNWYNYIDTSASGQTDKSQWANVMLMDGLTVYPNKETTGTPEAVNNSNVKDKTGYYVAGMGSMYVWIPRYEYSISGQTIQVNFISTATTDASTGYTIHPTFRNEYSDDSDSTNDFLNGGWDSELPGIWVAKFEASAYTNATASVTNFTSAQSSTVTTTYMARSLPGVNSWRYTTIGDMYTACRNITGSKAGNYGLTADDESGIEKALGKTYAHLMKNSEWGAVAYLTHSKYGRNGIEIYPNPDSSYKTGKAGTSTSAKNVASGSCYAYNTTYGVKASTTGNVYGIYDMSGGAYECVAAYNNTDTDGRFASYGSFATVSATNNSTKYATWYANGSTSSFTSSSHVGNKVGDATYETAGWNSDTSDCAYNKSPFFLRGGDYISGSRAGVFFAGSTRGLGNSGTRFPPSACSGADIVYHKHMKNIFCSSSKMANVRKIWAT